MNYIVRDDVSLFVRHNVAGIAVKAYNVGRGALAIVRYSNSIVTSNDEPKTERISYTCIPLPLTLRMRNDEELPFHRAPDHIPSKGTWLLIIEKLFKCLQSHNIRLIYLNSRVESMFTDFRIAPAVDGMIFSILNSN